VSASALSDLLEPTFALGGKSRTRTAKKSKSAKKSSSRSRSASKSKSASRSLSRSLSRSRSRSAGKTRRGKTSAMSTLMKASSRAARRLSHSPDPATKKKYSHAQRNVFPAAQAALKKLRSKA
jgi:hypothetical protein